MNKLDFSILGIVTESNEHSFQDDGFVDDIYEHTKNVYLRTYGPLEGLDDFINRQRTTPIPGGHYVHLPYDEVTRWVIFYRRANHPEVEIIRRAHEETHILHATGNLHLLEEKLNEKGVSINLREYPDFNEASTDEKEVIAYIGALYVLHKMGMDVLELQLEGWDKSFQEAARMYQQALINAKREEST